MTTLYRLYDNAGELLYIGIAEHWPSRMKQHAREKAWWDDVANVRLEKHDHRALAEAAEVAAIKAETPRHNVTHNPRAQGTEREYLKWLKWQSSRLDLVDDTDKRVWYEAFRRGDPSLSMDIAGIVKGWRLIVNPCPLCGQKHTHGWLTGEAEHEIAFRVPHCHPKPYVWQRIYFIVPEHMKHDGYEGPPMYDPNNLWAWEDGQRDMWMRAEERCAPTHGGAS